jgi:hypothetical protein
MMYLLDTSHDLTTCAGELGVGVNCVGQLITPLTRFNNRSPERFAIDNGAFSSFHANTFLNLLSREKPNREGCLFVVAPDVVCSARRTLELFSHWYARLQDWPIALACQNGQEDLDIPWHLIEAVFIGGDDRWKTSDAARSIVKCAKAMGKWAHVGRVNGPVRLEVVEEWGADSVDGTGISLHSHMRHKVQAYKKQPKLMEVAA